MINNSTQALEIPNEIRAMPTPKINYPELTRRQWEVFSLLMQGMSNKEIARALEIAESMTKIHSAALIGALGCATEPKLHSVR
jgi:DNA-binding NarL/FixJ family response regulator